MWNLSEMMKGILMSRVFVASDHHINHKNILNFKNDVDKPIRAGFRDVDHMNQTMVDNHNSVVTDQDKVYFLGDVHFGSKEEADAILSQMKGKKRLILGNHDDGKSWVLNKHFDKILMWRIFKEHSTILSHVPLHESTMNEGSQFNVHGHIHQNMPPTDRHICVCVEHINYTPVLLSELVQAHSEKTGLPIRPVGFRSV